MPSTRLNGALGGWLRRGENFSSRSTLQHPSNLLHRRGTLSFVETRYEHIILNADGVPMIAGTTMKVVELVLEKTAYGWSPEELHFQHPYLSLGQIHSALAYYWDHQNALDRDIARRLDGAWTGSSGRRSLRRWGLA